MKIKSILTLCAVAMLSTLAAQNPIREGLPEYGVRDCNIYYEGGKYYLTATEIPSPHALREGINLYESRNLKNWKLSAKIVDRDDVAEDSRYRDGWDSPEIQKIGGRYILTFGGRNNEVNPYAPTQIVIAECNKIDGEYKILTPNTLVRANRFSLFEDEDGAVYAYWELDGSLYGAQMNKSLTGFASEPKIILKPRELRGDDKFLDSPSMLKIGDVYHLVYTVFKGGYYAAYATSSSPLGKWSSCEDSVIFYRSEDQAPTELYGRYDDPLYFAPPCEIIGNVQFFKGRYGKWYVAYHSEDKYAEPYLCVDPATVKKGVIKCEPTLP